MTTISTALPAADTLGSLQDWRTVAALIDATLLRPDAARVDVEILCREALHYGYAAVFVHPTLLREAAWLLRGSQVKAGAPVGFSTGATFPSVKRFEAEELLRAGATELDMVMNVAALKSGDRALVQSDMDGVIRVGHDAGVQVKIILETSVLDLHEKLLASQLALAAGADFLKTSTGLVGGATVDDVALLRGVVGHRAGVKASGGIRTLADLTRMVLAGADRIGTSHPIAILRELGAPELP
jgi:deoxyribose-phosphate aldolase